MYNQLAEDAKDLLCYRRFKLNLQAASQVHDVMSIAELGEQHAMNDGIGVHGGLMSPAPLDEMMFTNPPEFDFDDSFLQPGMLQTKMPIGSVVLSND